MKLSALLKVAMLASVATVLMNFQFSLSLAFNYLKYDASEAPALIASFAINPLAGAAVVLLKNSIFLTTHFQPQELIGIPLNTISGLTFVLVAGSFYHTRKTRNGAKIALSLGVLAMVAVMLPLGMLVIPIFQRWFMPELAPLTSKALAQYLVAVLLPFNLCKGSLTSLITYFTYKRFSLILKSERLWEEEPLSSPIEKTV